MLKRLQQEHEGLCCDMWESALYCKARKIYESVLERPDRAPLKIKFGSYVNVVSDSGFSTLFSVHYFISAPIILWVSWGNHRNLA